MFAHVLGEAVMHAFAMLMHRLPCMYACTSCVNTCISKCDLKRRRYCLLGQTIIKLWKNFYVTFSFNYEYIQRSTKYVVQYSVKCVNVHQCEKCCITLL